jgi:hypothetical protein
VSRRSLRLLRRRFLVWRQGSFSCCYSFCRKGTRLFLMSPAGRGQGGVELRGRRRSRSRSPGNLRLPY